MADKGLFSYFKGRRKLEKSTFDMSCENLDSQRFFELRVKKCFEVMPSDKWKIGHNTITKVMPMNSPVQTRIKINTYTSFNENQSVWSHWNDFISNGSAFGDTYGNNVTNQALDNPWRIPQISVNDLQLISKLANGWAIPIYRLTREQVAKLLKYYTKFNTANLEHASGILVPSSVKKSDLYQTLFEMALSEYRMAEENTRFSSMVEIFSNIPYLCPVYKKSGANYILEDLTIGCSPYDAAMFVNWLEGSSLSVVDPSMSLNSLTPVMSLLGIRVFSDKTSQDLDINHGPFRLEKISVSDSLSSYRYKKNLYEDYDLGQTKTVAECRVRSYGAFWQKTVQSSDSTILHLNGVPYHSDTKQMYNDSEPIMAFLNDSYKDILCDSEICDLDPFDSIGIGTSTSPHTYVSPFSIQFRAESGFHTLPYVNTYFGNVFEDLNIVVPSYDLFVPMLHAQESQYVGQLPKFDINVSENSSSIGFDDFGAMIYLCKSAVRNLDAFNFPLEGPTSRDFCKYVYEYVNALPFFHYSKTWNDVFRNKTTSCAELDYTQTNSLLYYDYSRKEYTVECDALSIVGYDMPDWLGNFSGQNSWVIPMDYLPKSGLSEIHADSEGGEAIISAVKNEMHYFNINSWINAFSLLTGYGLQEVIATQTLFPVIDNYNSQGTIDYSALYGLLLDKFFFPSYYNGLLHTKYQNFPKDYFSSALLDPQSGANIVEVPDNIVELRNAQKQQSFWEGLAFARSIRSFYEQKFGSTPTHDDCVNTYLTGSSHSPVNIGEIVQTSQTDNTPQGTRTGLGAAQGNAGLCNHNFSVHGFILVIQTFTVELQYMQGLDDFLIPRQSFLDYPFPDFAHIGNESILQKQLNFEVEKSKRLRLSGVAPEASNLVTKIKYNGTTSPALYTGKNQSQRKLGLVRNLAQGSGSQLDSIFGYSPRWSKFKFSFDMCHGDMRHSLDYWHTFRKLFCQPLLCHEFVNGEFVAENDEFLRIFASTSEGNGDYFIVNMFVNASVSRAMPYVCAPQGV